MKEEINPNYLLVQEECGICLLPSTRPVLCKGPCHKVFCTKCVAESLRSSKNACPNRCSQPFQVELPSPVLRCPYNPQDCNMTISNPRHLADHFQLCLFISPEQRLAQTLKRNFKCSQNHSLIFIDPDAFQMIYLQGVGTVSSNELCSQCKQQRLCRSLCQKCSTREKIVAYCPDCRPLPCTKTQCPMGHRLRRTNKVGKNRFCDLCEAPALMMSNIAYGYCRCDFDLCEPCHNNLPDHHDAIPVQCNMRKLMELSMMEDVDSGSEWKQSK